MFILLVMLSSKCGQPCVSSLSYLQQWNLIGTQLFPIHQKIQNCDFGILVLGCTSKFFPIHKEIGNGFFECCFSWIPQFFPIYVRDWKLGFSKFPWFYILSSCGNCLSGRVYVMGRGADIYSLWNNFVVV